jgi:hypothetical protein
MAERSERARYITEVVALSIANEGTYDGAELTQR